tara:strand:- start:1156 stop:1317 length:162 start_codon:yes stop_codon:yes gene_type:complete
MIIGMDIQKNSKNGASSFAFWRPNLASKSLGKLGFQKQIITIEITIIAENNAV